MENVSINSAGKRKARDEKVSTGKPRSHERHPKRPRKPETARRSPFDAAMFFAGVPGSAVDLLPCEIWYHVLSNADDWMLRCSSFVCRDWAAIIRKIVQALAALDPPPNHGPLCTALVSADQKALLLWHRMNGLRWSAECCTEAVRKRDRAMLVWLRLQRCEWDAYTAAAAARNGDLDLLIEMRKSEDPCPMDVKVAEEAARGGYTEVLSWALGAGLFSEITSGIVWNAIKKGHVKVLTWCVRQEEAIAVGPDEYDLAARKGSLSILTWLANLDIAPDAWYDSMGHAVSKRNMTAVKHMRELGFPMSPRTFVAAVEAYEGDATCIEWLCAQGCPIDEQVMTAATATGSVWLLGWLAARYVPPSSPALCATAAENGHDSVLRWLREEHMCPWDEATPTAAAAKGNLPLLHWLLEQTCPMDVHTMCVAAANEGHVQVLEWCAAVLHFDMQRAELCDGSASRGHLGVLQWLRSLDPPAPWSEHTFASAVAGRHLHVVKWLFANGCRWSSSAVEEAAITGEIDILRWMHDNGFDLTESVFIIAVERENRTLVAWIHSVAPDVVRASLQTLRNILAQRGRVRTEVGEYLCSRYPELNVSA